MSKVHISNDSYNWFDRLDEMENSVKNIVNSEKSIKDIVTKTKKYFLDMEYEIIESIEENDNYRYVFYNKNKDESLVYILESELGLYYTSLAIHNEKIENIKEYSTQDNPNQFFSMFLD